MKKIILFLSLIVSTYYVTNAMAIPKITGVQGGYGISATIVNASGRNWVLSLQGLQIFLGMITTGNISSDYATIRTSVCPPALGFEKINIKVVIF